MCNGRTFAEHIQGSMFILSTAKNKTNMQGSMSKYPEKSLDSIRREGSRLRGKRAHDGWSKGQEHTTETLSQALPHRPQGNSIWSATWSLGWVDSFEASTTEGLGAAEIKDFSAHDMTSGCLTSQWPC